MGKQTNTAGSFPMLKTFIQTIKQRLVRARYMCALKLQTFTTKLYKFAKNMVVKMGAQIIKKKSGGVT